MLPIALILLAAPTTAHAKYILTTDLTSRSFFPAFNFFTGSDPTQGFVQYQSLPNAASHNLVSHITNSSSVYIGVDSTTKDPKGRASVRLESKAVFNHGLMIADIAHMPASTCGTWPAFWLLGKKAWPEGGEIDILEGVNEQQTNAITLHTSKGCVVANATDLHGGGLGDVNGGGGGGNPGFTGFMSTDDCDVEAAGQGKNVGCSISAPKSLVRSAATSGQVGTTSTSKSKSKEMGKSRSETFPSYGTPFNKAHGGIYAMQWTTTFISVWFFPFASPLYIALTAPKHSSSTSPDPRTFGPPIAHFSGAGCDFSQRFTDMRIVFDTTFCGQWAGGEWDAGGCKAKTGAGTCEEYVRENPGVFGESFWEVRGVRWFEEDGGKGKGKKGRWRRR